MVIQKELVEVQANRFVEHYLNLGYAGVTGRTMLSVPWVHLPEQSNKLILCQCDDCGVSFKRKRQQLKDGKWAYRCIPCGQKHRGTTLGRLNRSDPRERTAFKKYANVVRELTRRVYNTHMSIINPENYSRTKCGVEGGYQLDHKVSVKEGFEKKIPACEIAHINNLQMLSWKANRKKGAYHAFQCF